MAIAEQPIESSARVTLQVRLPMSLHQVARTLALQGKRSLNGQIIALIQKGIEAEHAVPTGDTRAG